MTEGDFNIVVGVDGSPSSRAALRWAPWEARLVSGTITALLAWDSPAISSWEPPGPEDVEHQIARTLRETVREVVDSDTSEPVHREVVHRNPAKALLAASESAQLLVLGNRGHGGSTGVLLGSITQHCTHHATVPVVVVRGTAKQGN